jgi:hypothetical protein
MDALTLMFAIRVHQSGLVSSVDDAQEGNVHLQATLSDQKLEMRSLRQGSRPKR